MRNFQKSEHACKCGCGLNCMDDNHMRKLDDARDMAGIPFIITSGCRCKQHNIDVGGEYDSAHLKHDDGKCYGTDIEVKNDFCRHQIIRSLLIAGFRRLGIGNDFIHADNDPTKYQRRIWKYGN